MKNVPLLKANDVSKAYGSLSVLRNIALELTAGEVVGLAGRNGAGKTTLINILAGHSMPDEGSVYVAGERLNDYRRHHPEDIAVVYQVPELAEQLDVTANIFLGQEVEWRLLFGRLRLPNQRRMDREASRLLSRLDTPFIHQGEQVINLSAEQRQLVSIVRVMVAPRRLIFIDDPMLALSIPYRQKLLQLIREWQQQGAAVLFADNNLDHLFAVSDRMLVIRDGAIVANKRTDETSKEEIVTALVGSGGHNQYTPTIWAMDSYYQAREQAEKLRHNQQLLERDLQARDTLNRQLVEQLGEQVKALDSANTALQDAQRRLMTEREQERKHLAREIHDQAIQDLLSINFELEEIEERVVQQAVTVDDIAEIRNSIRILIEGLRGICGDLRPPTIDSLGLDAAVRSYAREWSRRTGVAVKVTIGSGFGRLPEDTELSIFRIVQEGLNNIWKHAEATTAEIRLDSRSPRLLLISISDNGRGLSQTFDLALSGGDGHYGILGISERVALMGGRLRFANQPHGGMLLQAEIPHPRMVSGAHQTPASHPQ